MCKFSSTYFVWLVHLICLHLRQLSIYMILLLFSLVGGFIFCRSFPSLVFPAWRSCFDICCKAGWLVLLTFACLEKFISPSNLNESLFGESIGYTIPFITLYVSCHSLLACKFSVTNQLQPDWSSLYVICHFSLVAFNVLALSLILSV